MKSFHLVVLTPRERVYDGEAESVVIPTSDGEIGFLAGREETVVELVAGVLRFRAAGEEIFLETDGGVAEMKGKEMILLCGAAYREEEAEERKKERAAELSETRARQEKSLAEYKMTRAALMRAFDKLKRSKVK